MFLAVFQELPLVEERMKLHLVDSRDDIRASEKLFKMAGGVVADTDSPALAILQELGHGFPGFLPSPVDGPVNQVEVQIAQSETAKAFLTSPNGGIVSVVAVPQLSSHEDLVPGQSALANSHPNISLVSVDSSSINQTIAALQSIPNSIPGRFPWRRLVNSKA